VEKIVNNIKPYLWEKGEEIYFNSQQAVGVLSNCNIAIFSSGLSVIFLFNFGLNIQ